MEGKILYFDTPGKINTESTLSAARQRALELGIRQIVLASTHGYTARQAVEQFQNMDVDLTAVSICASFDENGWTMAPEERAGIEKLGVRVVTGLHALGDDVSEAFFDRSPNRIVRETLYLFCQGLKVAVEVAVMAADAGVLDISEEVIAIGGTDEGADTAIVLKPAYARNFKELEIKEILAKPR
jgi:hypothetical protein